MNRSDYRLGKNQILANFILAERARKAQMMENAIDRGVDLQRDSMNGSRQLTNASHLAGIQRGNAWAQQRMAEQAKAHELGMIQNLSQRLEGVEGLGAGRQRGSGERNALLSLGVQVGGNRFGPTFGANRELSAATDFLRKLGSIRG